MFNNMEHKRSSSKKQQQLLLIGRSKTTAAAAILCKKHPKHRQSPGVCAICLREKLGQLSTTSRKNNNVRRNASTISSCSSSSLSSLSSHESSNASSSCPSPIYRSFRARGSLSSTAFLRSGKNVFMKSKSMAFITQRRGGDAAMDGHAKKKEGFWSKLLRPRSKGKHDGLMHSKTMRERVMTGVH